MGCDHKPDVLQHHGVKGMRWGVRRFQNKDGSLTPAGEKRAARLAAKKTREDLKDRQVARRLTIEKAKRQMKQDSLDRENDRKNATRESKAKSASERAKAKNQTDDDLYEVPEDSAAQTRQAQQGKRLLIGAMTVVGSVAAVYAIKKISEKSKDKKKVEDTVKDAAKKAQEVYDFGKKYKPTKADKKAAKAVAKSVKAARKKSIKDAKDLQKSLNNFNASEGKSIVTRLLRLGSNIGNSL